MKYYLDKIYKDLPDDAFALVVKPINSGYVILSADKTITEGGGFVNATNLFYRGLIYLMFNYPDMVTDAGKQAISDELSDKLETLDQDKKDMFIKSVKKWQSDEEEDETEFGDNVVFFRQPKKGEIH